jgi:teichuronic acid exporter
MSTVPKSGRTFGNALSWSYVLNIGRISTTLGLSLLLARLLGPEAFGLIAMANVYILLTEILVKQGLFVAIVQFPDLKERHLSTAFWLIILATIILAPLSMALSIPWSYVNQSPELGPIIIWLSILLPLRGLSVVQEARFTRSMDFKLLAIRGNAAVLVGGFVGLLLALAGAGVWSLVVQQLSTALVETAVIWQASTWRPRRSFDRPAARQLLTFGWRNSLANIGNFANHRADALLIGLMFGPVVVGLYRMAARLIETALELAVGGLQAIALPELSKLSLDADGFRQRTLDLINMIAIIAAPAFATLAASSDALFRMLGPAWEASADPLKVLALLGFTAAISNLAGPVLDGLGRPGTHAKLMWLGALISVGTFVAAGWIANQASPQYELLVLAGLRTITFLAMAVFVVFPFLKRHAGISLRTILGAALPALTAASCGAALTSAAVRVLLNPGELPALIGFALVATSTLAGCALSVAIVDRRARRLALLVLIRMRANTKSTAH